MISTDDNSTADVRPRVFLETFGCQMNALDSSLVRGQLQSAGYRFVDDWKQADVVLYNTCSVREHAEQKVWSRVGEVGVHKRNRPDVVLGVIGCMAERDGQAMVRKYPQIDLLCGPGELDKVPMLVDNAIRTDIKRRGGVRNAGVALQGNTHRRSATLAAAEDELELIDLSRSFSPNELRGSAYVRITRGCNKYCTYCVVPNTRGREIHRPPRNILEECRRLVEAGVTEITLLGQTVNHYHFDESAAVEVNGVVQPQVGAVVKNNGTSFELKGMPKRNADDKGNGGITSGNGSRVVSFADLLAMICDALPALRRLRFVTSFPRDFGDDILQVMAERPQLCRYIHLPVQSGSNRMLKAMNRGYSVEAYRDLIQRVRRYLPDCQIATDIICGFPGETEGDHRATLELLRWARFKNAFIFKYSPRPGTAAYERLPDDVPDEVKRRRNNELLAVQMQASEQIHQSYVGKEIDVFVESISAVERKSRAGGLSGQDIELRWEKRQDVTQLTGRTDGDLIVCFDGDESLVGQIVRVRIEKAAPLTLFGKLVNAPVPSA